MGSDFAGMARGERCAYLQAYRQLAAPLAGKSKARIHAENAKQAILRRVGEGNKNEGHHHE